MRDSQRMELVIRCVSRAGSGTLPEPWFRVHHLYRPPVKELLAEIARRLGPLSKVHEVALEEALITRIAQLPFIDTKNTALSKKLFEYLCYLAAASVSASVRDAKSGLRHGDYDLGGSHGLPLLADAKCASIFPPL